MQTKMLSNTLTILFVYTHLFPTKTWKRAAERLQSRGIMLHFLRQKSGCDSRKELNNAHVVTGEVSQSLPGYEELSEASRKIKHRMFLGTDQPEGLNTFTQEQIRTVGDYLKTISLTNYINGISFLASLTGFPSGYEPVKPIQTHGIYHPDGESFFNSPEAYALWYKQKYPRTETMARAGILCAYNHLIEGKTADTDALIKKLEDHGIMPVCVFTDHISDLTGDTKKRYPWLDYINDGPTRTDILLNLLSGRLLRSQEDAFVLKELDVPVLQLIKNYSHTPEEWLADPEGLKSHSLVYSLSQPEMNGMIDPTLVACVDDPKAGTMTGEYVFVPISERIETLVRRALRWIRLKKAPNRDKRLTIVLHNNPCKGVESTLGMAVGLDTFESLSAFLKILKAEGYDVGDVPLSGDAIKNLFLEKKAISEFRWTTVDEIVKKGGMIHAMDRKEYHTWFDTLPETARDKVIEDWGPFPGQGMVLEHPDDPRLVITGLQFGNIQLMLQPKRGCYGAKCNGEVCRILHDPALSPPHHWLGTYNYIQTTSDAVIHFGAEGSLEYLPGKRAALSDACFPDISLGDLPNLYVYVMDIPGEGLMAKRRGRAVIVDHLTPVYLPATPDEDMARLEDLLLQYGKARHMKETARSDKILEQIKPLIPALNLGEIPDDSDECRQFMDELMRRIKRLRNNLSPMGLHILGQPPTDRDASRMMFTLLSFLRQSSTDSHGLSNLPDLLDGDVDSACTRVHEFLFSDSGPSKDHLRSFCRPVIRNIQAAAGETTALISALNGGFVRPGLGGSLYQGKLDTLPTGRNFYPTDISALPTPSAWEIGKKMTDKLLNAYYRDEGRFPENVGISIWSSDAFKSDGEVLCHIFYLLGVTPIWQSNGRISHLEVIPLEDLTLTLGGDAQKTRPRVDVTIQTSGIMRDMVPQFCDYMDEAVVLVSKLDEPETSNYVLKRTREKINTLKKDLKGSMPDKDIERLATFRVFSSAPGTYGLGVGLAIDASAWNTEDDLAETYINWGGYAYGSSKVSSGAAHHGVEAHHLLASQMKDLDISYMKQSSREYDVLDCGGFASFQGGMAVTGKALSPKRKTPRLYFGDTSMADDLDVRTMKDEIERAAQAKLFNRTWLEHMKEHGFQGAQTVANKVNNMFKLSATTRSVDKWLFDSVVSMYLRDEENREWLRQNNPYAMEEITRRLLEAHSRNLWDADEDDLDEVRHTALQVEGDMEETMGEVSDEFQGSRIDVMTKEDVEVWKPKYKISKSVSP